MKIFISSVLIIFLSFYTYAQEATEEYFDPTKNMGVAAVIGIGIVGILSFMFKK